MAAIIILYKGKSLRDGTYPIMIQINFAKKVKRVSTGLRSHPIHWDASVKKRPKILPTHPTYESSIRKLNHTIDIISKADDWYYMNDRKPLSVDEYFNVLNKTPSSYPKIKSEEYIGKKELEDIDKSSPFIVDGVTIGVPFNLKQFINKFGGKMIPSELGIYHLFYMDQLVYVGMSKNLRRRLKEHLSSDDMPFNNVLWFCSSLWKKNATVEDTLKIEYNMIKKYKPVLNAKGVYL